MMPAQTFLSIQSHDTAQSEHGAKGSVQRLQRVSPIALPSLSSEKNLDVTSIDRSHARFPKRREDMGPERTREKTARDDTETTSDPPNPVRVVAETYKQP